MKKRSFSLKEAGQTSLEYMLIIAVMASISLTLFRKLDDYFIKNPNNFIGRQLKAFNETMGSDGNYKYYRIR